MGGFRHAGENVEERGGFGGERGSGGEETEVSVEAGGTGVVVAGAEVQVGAKVSFFAANQEEHLAVGFETDESVNNVDAGLFHLFSPGDVIGFIKAGLEFDQHRNLFFVMGGGDECVEDRGVTAGAVEGHFDGENGGVGCGVFEERDDRGEAFVGVMKEDIPLADRFEISGSAGQGEGKGGREGRVAKAGLITARFAQGEDLCEVNGACDAIGIFRKELEVAEEKVFNIEGAIGGDFETDGGTPVPFLEFFLDGEEKILGFFLVDIELAISGDADGPDSVDFHSGKDFADKVTNEFGEEQVFLVGGLCGREMDEAWDSSGDLYEGVAVDFVGTWFGIENRQVDGFVKKLGERVTGIDGEGREDGEDVPAEGFVGPAELRFGEIANGAQVDAGFG